MTIKCLTVTQFYGKQKISIIYEKKEQKLKQSSSSIGIDLGVSNFAAVTTNDQSLSWIIKGGAIKSINQFYNKKLAELKSNLEIKNHKKSSKRLQRLNHKRHNKIDYIMHCASKRIIDLCLKHNISRIVIGHNKNWKHEVNLGKKNNQTFVEIPFNNFISKIEYKAKLAGIECIIVEESYTSKTDHLMKEEMKHLEHRSGKRCKRGMFISGCRNKILNADINGAIGILRKAKAVSDADLVCLRDRGDVVSPKVLKL